MMSNARLARSGLILVVFVLLGSMRLMNFKLPTAAASGEWQAQTYDPNKPGLELNPLKGFLPFSKQPSDTVDPNKGFPHSMEWFYVSLRDLMTGCNTYTGAPLDAYLNDIASRGNQAAFRVYVDYPGRSTGIPQFLLDGGLLTRDYDQNGNHDTATHSLAPDWNDANLNLALRQFVAALGARYDGDPRIGFVTAGLYGFWGEWHTWPYNTDPTNWEMNQTNRDALLTAFKDAFRTTHVLARYPYSASTASLKNAFGYHDDSFSYETLFQHDWDFWNLVTQNGLQNIWQTHPIGGEFYPPLQQDSSFWQHWPNQNGQSFQTSVETTHASWLMYDRVFKSPLPDETASRNALRAHKMLGYTLYNSAVQLPDSPKSSLQVNVKLQNKGVAPFYYNWPVEFGVLNASNVWVKSLGTAAWNLKSIQPGGTDYSFSFSANHNLAPGDYKLVMRVVNPLAGGKTLRFANTRQDANKDGWLTLTGFRVSASATTSTVLPDPPVTPGTQAPTPLVFDNFNDANQYNTLRKNDMGGGYWGDGSTSVDGTSVTLNGVSWWDATFSAAETNVDLSAYTYLVYVVKSSASGSSFNVTMWDAGGAKGTKTVTPTTAYHTIRIPLADFSGFDKSTARKFKHSAFTGSFTIDEIRFE